MKYYLSLSLLFISSPFVQAAVTVSEDFSNNDSGGFTALNNTQAPSLANDTLEFTSTSDQGSGVTLDFSDTFSGNLIQPLFFEFSAMVPDTNDASEELGLFFGPAVPQAQSGSITTGQNTNGFTLYINDQTVYAPDNSQGTAYTGPGNGQSVNLLSGLGVGTWVTFSVEWTPIPAQNSGQYHNIFNVTVDGFDANNNAISATETFDGAQNINDTQINDFQFTAATTKDLTGSIDNFTVSNMPIINIPEPSSALLALLSIPILLSRRRRG